MQRRAVCVPRARWRSTQQTPNTTPPLATGPRAPQLPEGHERPRGASAGAARSVPSPVASSGRGTRHAHERGWTPRRRQRQPPAPTASTRAASEVAQSPASGAPSRTRRAQASWSASRITAGSSLPGSPHGDERKSERTSATVRAAKIAVDDSARDPSAYGRVAVSPRSVANLPTMLESSNPAAKTRSGRAPRGGPQPARTRRCHRTVAETACCADARSMSFRSSRP